MDYPCIEKTIEVRHGETLVRLWIDITNMKNVVEEKAIIKNVRDCVSKLKTEQMIISYLAKTTPNVNAIQVIFEDELKNEKIGTVAYLVPFDDVHG